LLAAERIARITEGQLDSLEQYDAPKKTENFKPRKRERALLIVSIGSA